jgi:hypothetical protein
MDKSDVLAALDIPNAEIHQAYNEGYYWLNVMKYDAANYRHTFSATLPLEPSEAEIEAAKAKYAEWLTEEDLA